MESSWSAAIQVITAALLLSLPSQSSSQCSSRGCSCRNDIAICFNYARLTSIPKFPNTTTSLTITGSNIHIIYDELKELTKLQHLRLSSKIRLVAYSAFFHNTELITLKLDNNNISELQPKMFRNLTSLQTLILDGNRLTMIADDAFYGLEKLTTLSLKSNKLDKMYFSAMEPLKSLNYLYMTGNSIDCNCDIAWMKEFVPLKRAGSQVVCNSPSNLAGLPISNISYEDLNCDPPSIQPFHSDVVQGFKGEQGIELQCLGEGRPKPKVDWFFKNEKLVDSLHYRLPKNGSLLIVVMLPFLAGDYTCRVVNLMGSASAVVHLEYGGTRLPNFQQRPANIHVFVGSSFFLDCEADEITDRYYWTKGNDTLSSNDNIVVLPGRGLEVRNAQKNDSGTYYCVAVNEEGAVNASAVVSVTDTVITCDGIISQSIMEGFREKVDLAFNKTQQELLMSPQSPGSLLHRLRFPQSGIIEYLKAAEIFDQAVTVIRNQLSNGTIPKGTNIPDLSECELEVLGRLSGCEEHKKVVDCSSCFHQKYRTIDGSCNNLDNPPQGSSAVPFVRLLPPAYEDGIGLPVGWSGNKPSARTISSQILSTKKVTADDQNTLMLMQFGQFLDHDMDLAPASASDIVFDINNPESLSNCEHICHNDAPCFPIPVPQDDPRIHQQCIPFTRSSAVCGTGASSLLVGNQGIHREQINAITSYLDCSMVYSSTDQTAGKLRELNGTGKLLEGDFDDFNRRQLPFDNESLIECFTGIFSNRSKCFLGGDVRTNEQAVLTTMHTLFFREHNRIVAHLTHSNPHWDGERLYQEARKILIAEWQHIVFNEYLPKILGDGYLGEYNGYNASTDATIANVFATAAFRFGHSQIMPLFQRLDSNYESLPIGPLKLRDAFFAPFRILEEGGIDPLIRGLIATPSKMRLPHEGINNNLTEALFAQAHQIALDLAALNIQRGRDHGLPSYNKWRSFCNLSAPANIEGLQQHITNDTIRTLLESIYGDNPDNIDLWVGGLLEDLIPGTQLGPTFLCIIGHQFRRLRDGDRFYYERVGQFTPDQLVQIKQASLSRIICDNTNIDRVPADAFILQHTSQFVSCNQIPKIDLTLWKECSVCEVNDRVRRSTLLKTQTDQFQEIHLKIEQLEEKIGVCKFNGTLYNSEESWSLPDCIICNCQNGEVTCKKENC